MKYFIDLKINDNLNNIKTFYFKSFEDCFMILNILTELELENVKIYDFGKCYGDFTDLKGICYKD